MKACVRAKREIAEMDRYSPDWMVVVVEERRQRLLDFKLDLGNGEERWRIHFWTCA